MSTQTETATTGTTSTAGVWRVVAGREISVRMRDKGFVISAIVMAVLIVASIVLSSFLGGRPSTHTVAVVDAADRQVVRSASAVVDSLDDGSSVEAKTYDGAAAAERAVRDGDVDAALLQRDEGYVVVGDDSVEGDLSSALETAAATTVLERNAEADGVDLTALQSGTQVQERLLDPNADKAGERRVVSFVFVLLFYLTALGFGMMIAQSVTQEKESRVVEILAAAIPIRSLLWGKIIGNTVLALGQIVLLVGAGVVTLVVMGEDELLGMVGPAMAWYVVFFVLGFISLASLWSVAGSLASRQQDLQSTTLPGQIILFGPYLLAVLAGEGVKTVVSMLPIVSAMLMPSRMAEGDVPAWQIAVAIVTTVLAAVVLVRVGAKVYERTLLRTGSRIGYREALSRRVSAD